MKRKLRLPEGPIPKLMIALFVIIIPISALHPSGIVFGLAFLLLWVGLIVAIALFLIVFYYIIVGILAITAIGAIVMFLLGDKVAGLGLASIFLGTFLFFVILSLIILIYLLIPAILGAIATYVFITPGNIIVPIIVFIILAIISLKLLFPFMIGYLICSIAGQLAYLITIVGFSADAIQTLLFGGSTSQLDIVSILNNILRGPLISSAIGILIFIVSIIFGLLFVKANLD